jgi:hypothetical protein
MTIHNELGGFNAYFVDAYGAQSLTKLAVVCDR